MNNKAFIFLLSTLAVACSSIDDESSVDIQATADSELSNLVSSSSRNFWATLHEAGPSHFICAFDAADPVVDIGGKSIVTAGSERSRSELIMYFPTYRIRLFFDSNRTRALSEGRAARVSNWDMRFAHPFSGTTSFDEDTSNPINLIWRNEEVNFDFSGQNGLSWMINSPIGSFDCLEMETPKQEALKNLDDFYTEILTLRKSMSDRGDFSFQKERWWTLGSFAYVNGPQCQTFAKTIFRLGSSNNAAATGALHQSLTAMERAGCFSIPEETSIAQLEQTMSEAADHVLGHSNFIDEAKSLFTKAVP